MVRACKRACTWACSWACTWACTWTDARAAALAIPLAAVLATSAAPAGASSSAGSTQGSRYCDASPKLTAAQQDRIFRFGAVVRAELQRSGARLALLSRSGLDLSRFDQRYSHAGISLMASPETPWAVRQLYYDCDGGQPRIFDQGLLAFLSGTDDPGIGYISAVLLPEPAAQPLEVAALDNRTALSLLASTYSANAYPYGLQYQNCNQWLTELLATAWGALVPTTQTDVARAQAQGWLREQGYQPSSMELGWRPLTWLHVFIPWVFNDDHPAEDLAQARYRVSMPASIEAFVRAQAPAAQRIEFCHNSRQVVVRRGWTAIAEGCEAAPGDEVVPLD